MNKESKWLVGILTLLGVGFIVFGMYYVFFDKSTLSAEDTARIALIQNLCEEQGMKPTEPINGTGTDTALFDVLEKLENESEDNSVRCIRFQDTKQGVSDLYTYYEGYIRGLRSNYDTIIAEETTKTYQEFDYLGSNIMDAQIYFYEIETETYNTISFIVLDPDKHEFIIGMFSSDKPLVNIRKNVQSIFSALNYEYRTIEQSNLFTE